MSLQNRLGSRIFLNVLEPNLIIDYVLSLNYSLLFLIIKTYENTVLFILIFNVLFQVIVTFCVQIFYEFSQTGHLNQFQIVP